MFSVAFACSVATITAPNAFTCSDRTHVELAAVKPVHGDAPSILVSKKLRCQGFDSRGAGRLIATCRFADGRDVGCALVSKGVVTEVARQQRRYELPSCALREALRKSRGATSTTGISG